jgi:hypothetical protein
MNVPEVIKPAKRCYGILIGLSLDCSWMLCTFVQDGEARIWECPESDLFSLLSRYLVSGAKARLVGTRDRRLIIEKTGTGWQIESQ